MQFVKWRTNDQDYCLVSKMSKTDELLIDPPLTGESLFTLYHTQYIDVGTFCAHWRVLLFTFAPSHVHLSYPVRRLYLIRDVGF